MRIVQALGWYYPESLGGTEVYVSGLARRLSALGHEVFIAAPHTAHAEERTYEHDGIPVYRYPIPAQPTRAECQGDTVVRGAPAFHAWLAKQCAHIVHIHTFVTGLGLAEVKAAKATGAKVIVTTHSSSLGFICQRATMMRWGEYLCDGICRPAKCAACELQHRGMPKALAWTVGMIPPPLGRLASTLPGAAGTALSMSDLISRNQARQREMLATADKFVLLTQKALTMVAANGGSLQRLGLNRLGVSHTNIDRKPSPEIAPTRLPIQVGYLGRLESIKGVHDLVRAVATLPRNVPVRVELRGPVRSDAERRVVDELKALAGNDSRVIFADAAPPSEVPGILASYDVLCCPSVCLEGGPTVALEAHAVGTPVVGTHIGGLAEVVEDGVNGCLVPPGDWRALAQVLRRMADDPSGSIDRWRRALPQPRSMDDIAADYLALYRQ